MGKLFYKTILFFTPIVLMIFLSYILYFNTSNNRSVAYEFKQELLLKNKEKQKIILIGGSNCRYSYSSETIREAFPEYEVLNCCIAAPYGLKFYFDFILPYVRKGDLIILSPEYMFINTKNGVFGGESLVQLAYSNKDFYEFIFSDFSQSVHFLSLSFKHLIKMEESIRQNIGLSHDDIKDQFLANHDHTGQVINYPIKNSFANYKISADGIISKDAKDVIRTYSMKILARGGKLLYNFPSVEKTRFRQTFGDREYTYLFSHLFPEMVVLNQPSNSIYSTKYFYDSPYHLNEQGKVLHTIKMCENLRENKDVQ